MTSDLTFLTALRVLEVLFDGITAFALLAIAVHEIGRRGRG